jgi:hypothetical protein
MCIGATVTGNTFTQNCATNVSLTLTNDAVLTWQWQTNYWLATSTGPNGSVYVGNGWQVQGTSTQITALASKYYHFANWSGSDSSSANPLNLLINAPKSVTAKFAADMTESHPTPHWWLAQYGLMNFEADASLDPDSDGLTSSQEYLFSTCPTNAFTAGNPFNDGVLVAVGANPLQNVSQFFAAITNHPVLFGLYTTNNVSDLSLGHPMINVVSNNARVWMTLEVSHDLSSNTWTNVGEAVEWIYPVNTNKSFFRFHGSTEQ